MEQPGSRRRNRTWVDPESGPSLATVIVRRPPKHNSAVADICDHGCCTSHSRYFWGSSLHAISAVAATVLQVTVVGTRRWDRPRQAPRIVVLHRRIKSIVRPHKYVLCLERHPAHTFLVLREQYPSVLPVSSSVSASTTGSLQPAPVDYHGLRRGINRLVGESSPPPVVFLGALARYSSTSLLQVRSDLGFGCRP